MSLSTIDHISARILGPEALKHSLAVWRFQDKKIVFTNGVFDILHLGHVDYLAKAADLGDILVIGVNSDSSVKKLKGPQRPVNSEKQRCMLLAALQFVDAVVLFEEDTPYDLIKIIQPDILVKGADYAPSSIAGYDIVMAKGGQVKTIELLEGYSTTSLINRLREK